MNIDDAYRYDMHNRLNELSFDDEVGPVIRSLLTHERLLADVKARIMDPDKEKGLRMAKEFLVRVFSATHKEPVL